MDSPSSVRREDLEALVATVAADPRLRWASVASAVIAWVALAMADVTFLLLLLAPAAVVWLVRRYPYERPEPDDFL